MAAHFRRYIFEPNYRKRPLYNIILKLFTDYWATILPAIVTISSIVWGIYSHIQKKKLQRAINTHISSVIDTSHSTIKIIEDNCTDKCVKEVSSNLNHQITCLLAYSPKLAVEWVHINKPEKDWPLWEQKLQISLSKFKKK